MYDISQLNELLVPELHDIAEQINIPNSKKMHKQDLISAIIVKQNNMSQDNTLAESEKPKRKRIAKTEEQHEAPEARQEEMFKKEVARPKRTEIEKSHKKSKKLSR